MRVKFFRNPVVRLTMKAIILSAIAKKKKTTKRK